MQTCHKNFQTKGGNTSILAKDLKTRHLQLFKQFEVSKIHVNVSFTTYTKSDLCYPRHEIHTSNSSVLDSQHRCVTNFVYFVHPTFQG